MTNTTNPTTLTFADRAAFIAWRAEWRTDYAALSLSIREVRKDNVVRQKAGKSDLQYELHVLRNRANAMMELRTEAKELSRAHYAAQQMARAAMVAG